MCGWVWLKSNMFNSWHFPSRDSHLCLWRTCSVSITIFYAGEDVPFGDRRNISEWKVNLQPPSPPSLLFQIPSHITFLKLTVNTKWNRSHKDLILSFQRLRRYISFARNISHKFWILVLSNQLFIQFQCRCFQNIENNLQIAFGFNRLKIKQQGNVGNCLRTPQLKLMSPKK